MRPSELGVIMNVDLRLSAREARRVELGGLGGTEQSRMGLIALSQARVIYRTSTL